MQVAHVRSEVSRGTSEGFGALATTIPKRKKPTKECAEIIAVLDRAACDPDFIAQLTYSPDAALKGYNLSHAAKAALESGDVRWIESCVGKGNLDARLRTWLECRLEGEIW